VAVIVAPPAATPVTRPLPETVATADPLLAHTTTRPDSAVPAEFRVDALSWSVPAGARLPLLGFTTTLATELSIPVGSLGRT
jgi:hypothetical protein